MIVGPGNAFVAEAKKQKSIIDKSEINIFFEGVIDRFEESCFSECKKLTKVVFASEQKTIVPHVLTSNMYSRAGVFNGCKNLKIVDLPDAFSPLSKKDPLTSIVSFPK